LYGARVISSRAARRTGFVFVVAVLAALGPRAARALDKQGSAHGGAVDGDGTGFGVSGGVALGAALHNPSYAARPDNTGRALFRYALHADVDVLGRWLSIPLDVNMFTDRTRKGALKLAPTELDLIGGLTTTFAIGPGALEIGARGETDRPLDRAGLSQSYGSMRARYLYALSRLAPGLARVLADGDVSGDLSLGWFTVNPSYAARPDNTGLALFRYGGHTELGVWHRRVAFGVDATMFTDRDAESPVRPSELDLTAELVGRAPPFELHIASERDMPLDRGHVVQAIFYGLASYAFDWKPKR
jgi:hypothetical protein